MTTVGNAVRSILAADGTVSGLVGTRIYADRLPENVTFPAIEFTVNEQRSFEYMGGLTGQAEAFVEVFCWGSRSQANTLADGVRLALANYQGTAASVDVRRIHTGTGRQDHQEPKDSSDKPKYWHEREYHVFYVESTS